MNKPRQKYYPQQKLYHKHWYQLYGKQYEAEARIAIKVEVLTYYGKNKCACVICGESRLACISIDHIDGGGVSHRKELNAYGYKFYRKLKRDNFPKGYQTLCMNCQFLKVVMDRAKAKEMPDE